MPWRSSKQVFHCAVCEGEAKDVCPRCGRHLCDIHSPPPEEVCDGCEADFTHRASALTKPQPKPMKGAFKVAVGYPSVGLGVFAGSATLVAGVAAGGGVAAFGWGLVGLLWGTMLGAVLTIPAYFLFGTPIFARRKIKGLAQRHRLSRARRDFDNERRALPAPDSADESADSE